MIGVEFETADDAEAVQWACFQRGLLVLECGRSAVRVSPPLTITADELRTGLRLFIEAVEDVATSERQVLVAAAAAGALGGVEAGG